MKPGSNVRITGGSTCSPKNISSHGKRQQNAWELFKWISTMEASRMSSEELSSEGSDVLFQIKMGFI